MVPLTHDRTCSVLQIKVLKVQSSILDHIFFSSVHSVLSLNLSPRFFLMIFRFMKLKDSGLAELPDRSLS